MSSVTRWGPALALVLGAGAIAAGLSAKAQAPQFDQCLLAERVIVEAGKPPLANQTIRIQAGRIADVQPGRATEGCAAVQDLSGHTVLPGLIDAHVHLLGELNPNARLDRVAKGPETLVVDGAANARKTLLAGFTTVVDLGGEPDSILALRNGIAEG